MCTYIILVTTYVYTSHDVYCVKYPKTSKKLPEERSQVNFTHW